MLHMDVILRTSAAKHAQMGAETPSGAERGYPTRQPRFTARGSPPTGFAQEDSGRTAPRSELIRRAAHPETAAIQYVRVNRRHAQIRVAQELLHGPDVRSALEQMRRERVTQ